MKKTMKKVVALGSGAALLVSASVMGTMAYLTSTTDVVENTFTVGNVKITLDEAKVDTAGDLVADADRVTENTYKLMPNHEYTKDPTIHVDDDSEDCWLFVKVENEITAIEAADTVATQMANKGWSLVNGETNVYAHEDIANAGDDVVIFEYFKILGSVDNTELAGYDGSTINVVAYAVQADGFDTAEEAWEDAEATWPTIDE